MSLTQYADDCPQMFLSVGDQDCNIEFQEAVRRILEEDNRKANDYVLDDSTTAREMVAFIKDCMLGIPPTQNTLNLKHSVMLLAQDTEIATHLIQ